MYAAVERTAVLQNQVSLVREGFGDAVGATRLLRTDGEVCVFVPVSGSVDEHVFSLIDKSLVTVQRSTPVRYRLLEVVRQFSERRLSMRGELDEVGRRLVAHYGEWVTRADAGVRVPTSSAGTLPSPPSGTTCGRC